MTPMVCGGCRVVRQLPRMHQVLGSISIAQGWMYLQHCTPEACAFCTAYQESMTVSSIDLWMLRPFRLCGTPVAVAGQWAVVGL